MYGLQQEKRKLTRQGKDRDWDACNSRLIQTLRHATSLKSRVMATHRVQGPGGRGGGLVRDCSSCCVCWFSAKNEGLREMVIPESSFALL